MERSAVRSTPANRPRRDSNRSSIRCGRSAKPARPSSAMHQSAAHIWIATTRKEPKVCRLSAGGEWIRTSSSASAMVSRLCPRRDRAPMERGGIIEHALALGRETALSRGNSTSRRSPSNEAAPPEPRRVDVEPDARPFSTGTHPGSHLRVYNGAGRRHRRFPSANASADRVDPGVNPALAAAKHSVAVNLLCWGRWNRPEN
jgi:hypothetical protein